MAVLPETTRPDTRTPGPLAELRDAEFHAFRSILYDNAGIVLSDGKREMVSARLARRLRHYGFRTYAEYYAQVTERDKDGSELREMINCLTTNKTGFFREPHHFEYLRERVLAELKERAKQGGPRRLRIWSAGCSTGEEPYTLAMSVLEHFGPSAGWDVRILASDIDSDVLARAERGRYDTDDVEAVPPGCRKYFVRTVDGKSWEVRPDCKNIIAFRRINLIQEEWPVRTTFDAIFCRNVVIYFDRPTQQKLFGRFARHLADRGHLFLGHSENLHGLSTAFTPLGNTVYQLGAVDRPDPVVPPARSITDTPPPRNRNLPEAVIIAGEVYANSEPSCVSTLLGSCVAACVYDPVAGVGGMNHFLLPQGLSHEADTARFGVHAMELLINDVMRHGGDRRRLRAKIFGGAHVLPLKHTALHVGARNVEFVRQFLSDESIPVVSEYLGGSSGLKVRFQTHTGRAFVKALDGTDLSAVLRREADRASELAATLAPAADNVTLF